MEAAADPVSVLRRTRHTLDRVGDSGLRLITAAAAALVVLIIVAIIWKVIDGAWPAVHHFGLGFIWNTEWNPVTGVFGARWLILGTLEISFGAVLIAAPLSIAIGLFLSELAPPAIRGPIGSLIEMLAAVPSVVVGLWGILVLGPFMRSDIEPFLHDYLGWIPIFSGSPSQNGVLIAIVVLTMMIIPITSSICRELFSGVPRDIKEASIGLGATHWEMVRGVVVPHVRGGVVAGVILGLGRALGEAIAVTQVIGNSLRGLGISLFGPGNSLASQLATEYQGAGTNLEVSALFYLALLLLAITFVTNFVAQRIVHRFDRAHAGAH
ncbi:MAG: phosphate ABC transporter permease subunit PstC [Actinomycetes bacterium]